jgi:hypothetical protein
MQADWRNALRPPGSEVEWEWVFDPETFNLVAQRKL